MLEKLFEFVLQIWNRLSPCEIIPIYSTGAVLRLGLFHRIARPGLCWKWPVVEDVMVLNTVITTLRLPPQTLTTKDDVCVVVAAIIKYKVIDVMAYITEIWDQHDVLEGATMGAIRGAVRSLDYKDLISGAPEKQVIDSVRAEINEYGFKVLKITFTDMGKVRSYRLIQHGAHDMGI